jgi:hypothetical protein
VYDLVGLLVERRYTIDEFANVIGIMQRVSFYLILTKTLAI